VSTRTEIHGEHSLFVVLRNGLFWHRTGSAAYRQIVAEGEKKWTPIFGPLRKLDFSGSAGNAKPADL